MKSHTITIEGINFSDLEGFYNEIDRVLTKDLDWQTGHNLDALFDLLRGGFGVHDYEEPIAIIWTHSEKSGQDLGWDATVRYLQAKLTTCHPTAIDSLKADLELARQNQGKTLFERIVEIMKEHEHIDVTLA
ncbi:MAG: barstar family protein [Ignavibacteria bacterium]|nr:barstar family protein [Ignavibacteria bacterium]